MKPYALDKRHPTVKASTKLGCLRSSAYMTIMNVSAITPKTVMAGLLTATSPIRTDLRGTNPHEL
jgi:hypothetical protein